VNGKNGMTRWDTLTTAAHRELARFYADESGATAIEYAMMASFIGVAIATAVYALGTQVAVLYTAVAGLFP
jgi:pilus assembly protein Flp/PilA